MRHNLIIFEGPDQSGKSTLISELSRSVEVTVVFHYHGRPHIGTVERWHAGALRFASKRLSASNPYQRPVALLDRHWPSEMIYGTVMREGAGYDVEKMALAAAVLNPLYVWCSPQPFKCSNAWAESRVGRLEYVERWSDMLEIESMYSLFYHGLPSAKGKKSWPPIFREIAESCGLKSNVNFKCILYDRFEMTPAQGVEIILEALLREGELLHE